MIGMPSFNPSKLKAQLRAAVTRIGLAKGKRTSAVQNQKREIADLLRASPPRVEKARIRCEGVIRTDFTIEALEVLELFCLSLVERMGLIKEEKGCPPDLMEGVSTLIWAAPRAQIKELEEARKLLAAKYGSAFARRAERDEGRVVNERVLHRLSTAPPPHALVLSYLRAIASDAGIEAEGAEAALAELLLPGNVMDPLEAPPPPSGEPRA